MKYNARSALFLSVLLVLWTHLPCRATTVCEVQDYDPSTGFSWLVGQNVTVTGVITVPAGIFVPSETSMYIRGIGDDSCGVNIFTFGIGPGVQLGDTVTVTGEVQEYILPAGDGSTTEIVFGMGGVTDVRKSDTLYVEPQVMETGMVGREENEGRLVRVMGKVVGKDGSREITVDDNSGSIDVFDFARAFESDPVWRDLRTGDVVTVTGIVAQAGPGPPYLSGYSIWPRGPEPPYEDVTGPPCIPDTVAGKATLSITDPEGNEVALFCPECPGVASTVIIKYKGPHEWRTRLRIFDVYGRNVATLDDYVTLCGETGIEWSGRNEVMERLPVGLYHVVVTATDPRTGHTSQDTAPIVIGTRLK